MWYLSDCRYPAGHAPVWPGAASAALAIAAMPVGLAIAVVREVGAWPWAAAIPA